MNEYDKLDLRKFDMKSMLSDATVLLSGCRRSGKSFLLRDMFYHKSEIPAGVVFSKTEEASPFFGKFIPDSFIHTKYNPEIVQSILTNQAKIVRKNIRNGIGIDGKTKKNNKFIVLDDMMADNKEWKNDDTIKNIFFNGRHYNILFILTLQYAMGIGPDLRGNVDYVFIFNTPSIKNRRKIYEDYASMIPSFDYFCNILEACTQDHQCLVIKTTGVNSNKLSDQVFWYKAEEHKNFRVGCSSLWKYHDYKYNNNYQEDNEHNDEHIHDLKKKYEKTNKLKVIVSRTGDIVECSQSFH